MCQILIEQSKENAEIGRKIYRTGSIYLSRQTLWPSQTEKNDYISISIMKLNILILNSYQYIIPFSCLYWFLKTKYWNNIGKKYFSQEGGGGCLIMAMSTGACWAGHFCVEPGIFVSNRAFLCRTSVIINVNSIKGKLSLGITRTRSSVSIMLKIIHRIGSILCRNTIFRVSIINEKCKKSTN